MTALTTIEHRAGTGGPDMGRSYDDYFQTGLYSRRYPAPNRRVLRYAAGLLRPGATFLDYGAGTGRYCVPLLRATGTNCIAFDISHVALETLSARFADLIAAGRLDLAGPRVTDLEAAVARHPPLDLAMLAFGVLGHVAGRRARLALLRTLHGMLAPGGSLLLGVPNARRRFREEQRAAAPMVAAGRLEPGDILYQRAAGDHQIDLYYHLYSLDEITRDVEAAGFAVTASTAESILPEHAVVAHPTLGMIDDRACDHLPVRYAYGFLLVARKA